MLHLGTQKNRLRKHQEPSTYKLRRTNKLGKEWQLGASRVLKVSRTRPCNTLVDNHQTRAVGRSPTSSTKDPTSLYLAFILHINSHTNKLVVEVECVWPSKSYHISLFGKNKYTFSMLYTARVCMFCFPPSRVGSHVGVRSHFLLHPV